MYFNESAQDVLKQLESDENKGLSQQQAQKNLARYGYNELVEQKKQPLWLRFLLQFSDPLIILLIRSGLIPPA